MKKLAVAIAFITAAGAFALASRPAEATLPMQKKAKELGFEAKDCLYCHGEKLPKKGTSTMNDRGKWLMAEKEKRQAKEVDVAWLKEYVEKK